ncbi:MAG: hypothetical protein NVS4B11_38330 [Ktedonobacteraceae bacterium]
MSTPSDYIGNGTATETSLQREDTKEQIYDILQHFDVLPSRFDRFIFKYIYVYLIGLFFLSELFFIILLLSISSPVEGSFLSIRLGVLPVIAIISVLWAFNVWRLSTPKTLRDLLEKKRISLPNSDANQSYLRFLENYRDALASPKRYFLSGFLMVVVGTLDASYIVQYIILTLHLNIFATILFVISNLLLTLGILGGLYCIGLVTWAVYISGWYIRQLVRVFEFRIQPFHTDKCGGLKLLGNFCFGLASPILIGSGLIIGNILLSFVSSSRIGATFLALIVGFPLLLLLVYNLPVIVLAFMLPLWDIHTKMVSEGEVDEETHSACMEVLREEIQLLLDTNQVEAAKTVQEKKALVETLHTSYPTWPFRFRSKIFSTVLGVSGSLLIGVITAALQQYILSLLFHTP